MARYATDSDLTTRIPATASASAEQRGFALADATAMIRLDAYGDRSVRAHVLLAAHYLVLAGAIDDTEFGRPVTAARAGEINASFGGDFGTMDASLATTGYGGQFLEIRRTLVSHPEVG